MVDTRNLNDPTIRNEMIRKLHNFLVNECGITDLTEKVLRSPSQRDFVTLFESIYQHLDPKYTISARVEEEVPRLLNALGYPFTLKSSSLQTIGASHSWPHLLGALVWLVDFIILSNSISTQDVLVGTATDPMKNANVFQDSIHHNFNYTEEFKRKHCEQLMSQMTERFDYASQKKEVEERVEILEEELKILHEEHGELEERIRAQSYEHGLKPESARALKGELAVIRNEAISLKNELNQLSHELWVNTPAVQGMFHKLRSEISAYVERINVIRENIEDKSSMSNELKILDVKRLLIDTTRNLKAEIEKFTRAIQVEQTSQSEATQRLNALRRESAMQEREFAREIDTWTNTRKTFEEELTSLQNSKERLAEKETVLLRLEEELKRILIAQSDIEEKHKDLEEDYDNKEAIYQMFTDEIKKFEECAKQI